MTSVRTRPASAEARRGSPRAGAGRSERPAGERRPARRRAGGLTVTLRRAYDTPAPDDGPRVLVDRVRSLPRRHEVAGSPLSSGPATPSTIRPR